MKNNRKQSDLIKGFITICASSLLTYGCSEQKGADEKFVSSKKIEAPKEENLQKETKIVEEEKIDISPIVTELADSDVEIKVDNSDELSAEVEVSEEEQTREVVESPIVKEKPALALRTSSCIMCHAKISSNVITDFGLGSDYFLGGQATHPLNGGPIGNRPQFLWGNQGWGGVGAKIVGDLVIPKVKVNVNSAAIYAAYNTADLNREAKAERDLADLLKETYSLGGIKSYIPLKNKSDAIGKNFDEIPVGLYGEIKEKSEVYIGAPKESEILAVTTDKRKLISDRGISIWLDKNAEFSEFKIIGDNAENAHLELGPGSVCHGDVIIDGVVRLNQAEITTNALGCRLYVTKSVFITGEVKFNGHEKATAQISSARAIFIGINTNAAYRAKVHFYGTRDVLTPATRNDYFAAIDSDINHISSMKTEMDDAGPQRILYKKNANNQLEIAGYRHAVSGKIYEKSNDLEVASATICPTFGNRAQVLSGEKACLEDWAGAFKRKEVNQSGLLLNAPMIHNRYFGEFNGIVIAEYPLFAVGKFSFSYDNKFNFVDFLPLLSEKVLRIKD